MSNRTGMEDERILDKIDQGIGERKKTALK
jgi:hypothetical protein